MSHTITDYGDSKPHASPADSLTPVVVHGSLRLLMAGFACRSHGPSLIRRQSNVVRESEAFS